MPNQGQRTHLRYLIYFSGIAILLSQLACQASRNSNRLVIAAAGKITSLDPAQASTFNALQLISALGDPLYRMNEKGSLTPQLASGPPQISDEGLTISIPLRKGVRFHDGTLFDSKAMAFSLKRFMKIGTQSYLLGGRISSIETPKPFLFRLRLTRPSSSINGLLTSINLTPISPTAYSEHQEKFLNKRFIGTGPYLLKSFQVNQQRLEPFDLYWGEKPRNEGIDFINLSNSTSLFSALQSGEVDVLLSNSLNDNQKHYLHKISLEGNIKEGKGSALEIGYITFNTRLEPFNNKNLRKALLHSLDRNLISKRVSFGLRSPLRSLVPPILNKKVSSPWPKYDPKKSKFLLRQEGYCSGQKLILPLTFRSNVPADKLLALTWQAQVQRDLSDCLEIKPNGIESTTIYRQLAKGAFEAVILDWRGAYPDPEAYLGPLLSCKQIKSPICQTGEAANSGSFWAVPSLESALKQSDELRSFKRIQKLNEIEQIAQDGAAYLPIWLVSPKAWAQNRITKPEFDGSGQLLLNRLKELN